MVTPVEVRLISGVDWYEEADHGNSAWRLSVATYGKCVYWVNGDKQIMEKGNCCLFRPAFRITAKASLPSRTRKWSFNGRVSRPRLYPRLHGKKR